MGQHDRCRFHEGKASFNVRKYKPKRCRCASVRAQARGSARVGPPGKRVGQENDTRALPLRAWQERAPRLSLEGSAVNTFTEKTPDNVPG